MYYQQIVPPVLNSFLDQDSRVRYYACEALYNIAKVCLGLLLRIMAHFLGIVFQSIFFNDYLLFLCRLSEGTSLYILIRYLMHFVSFLQIQIPVCRVLHICWIGL